MRWAGLSRGNNVSGGGKDGYRAKASEGSTRDEWLTSQ
jgi:hypothetical protein